MMRDYLDIKNNTKPFSRPYFSFPKRKLFTRLIVIFFLCIPYKSLSITKEPKYTYGYHFMQFFYHTGINFGPTRYLKDQYTWGSRAYELRFGFQSKGDELWQQYHRLPQYGLGIHFADLIANKEDTTIGNPISVFMFFNAPFIRWSKFKLSASLSLGLSYTSKCHDPVRNPYNDVIGSCVNLYFDTNLNLDYSISRKINLITGIGLTHYSNGAIDRPQMGMNTLRINMGLSYNFCGDSKGTDRDFKLNSSCVKQVKRKRDSHNISTHETLQFMFSMGIIDQQKIGELEGRRYTSSSFTADYAFPLTPINNLTFGLDLLYNESLNRTYPGLSPEEVSFIQKSYLGSHMGFQVIIQRITLLINLGTYFRQSSYVSGFWFLRAGENPNY